MFALWAGLVTLTGIIGVIELLYRGTLVVGVNVAVTWVFSGLLVLVGAFFLRRAIRAVTQVWEDLTPELARWS